MNRNVCALLPLLALMLAACREQDPIQKHATLSSQDRRELVLQPREKFSAGTAVRKLELNLISQKTRIRLGEGFVYRLEIRNTGARPAIFKETPPSFIKDGVICGDRYQFYATPPGGKESRLPCEAQNASDPPESGLDILLGPGEYLLTRPRAFRRLRTSAAFAKLGFYRIKVVYVDGPYRSESNSIRLQVVP